MSLDPGDRHVSPGAIEVARALFRTLEGWRIADTEEEALPDRLCLAGQGTWNVKRRVGEIYPCPPGVEMSKYVLHEVVHAALRAASSSREAEEEVTQDLTALLMQVPGVREKLEAAGG